MRGYLSLAPNYVLAARLRFGTITGQVPATERYFGGGTSSMRGFGARQLSPFASSTLEPGMLVPIGGAGLFETGVELRTPFGFGLPLSSVFFLDGGDVTFAASDIDPSNLHWAAGYGLRVPTPIGPIGVDLAYRLTRTNDDGINPDPVDSWIDHFNLLIAVGEAY